MLRINTSLLSNAGLNVHSSISDYQTTTRTFFQNLVSAKGILPSTPFVELHPYKHLLPLQNYRKYIIGTFPPLSYMLDDQRIITAGIKKLKQPKKGRVISAPWIPFFHGNLGSQWDYLLSTQEVSALNNAVAGTNGRVEGRAYLKNWLAKHQVNYADIIDGMQRSTNKEDRYDGTDSNLFNIQPNNELVVHLLSNPHAEAILFNTASIFSNSGIELETNNKLSLKNNCKSFDLFVRHCQDMGLEVLLKTDNEEDHPIFNWTELSQLTAIQGRNRLIFSMKLVNREWKEGMELGFPMGAEKILQVFTPLSPAAVNRGRSKNNGVVAQWLSLHPGSTVENFLKATYSYFIQKL